MYVFWSFFYHNLQNYHHHYHNYHCNYHYHHWYLFPVIRVKRRFCARKKEDQVAQIGGKGGGGGERELIWAMPVSKHSFFWEFFPYLHCPIQFKWKATKLSGHKPLRKDYSEYAEAPNMSTYQDSGMGRTNLIAGLSSR